MNEIMLLVLVLLQNGEKEVRQYEFSGSIDQCLRGADQISTMFIINEQHIERTQIVSVEGHCVEHKTYEM